MNASMFETAVHDYLTGLRDWDSVHQLALDWEVEGVDFPAEVRRPLEELHLVFLAADSRDDPQFRADRQEISKLLTEIDRLRNDARDLGSNVVAECQDILDQEQEQNRRLKYLEKRERRQTRS
jgi:hypothetical protein